MDLFSLENPFLLFLQSLHTPWLNAFMVIISRLGNIGMIWIFLGIALLIKKDTRKAGFMILLSMALGAIIGNLMLKNLIMRSRPCWINPDIPLLISTPKDFSFPSGHTLAAFAASSSLYFSYKKAGIGAFILATLMGFSRLYLYVHFPTDVLAGGLIGFLCAYTVAKIFPLCLNYFQQSTPKS